jgi:hypothetical protein
MESMKHSRDASPRGDFQNDKRAAIFRIYNYKSVKIDFDFRMRDVSVLIFVLKTSTRPKALLPEKNSFSLICPVYCISLRVV